MTENQMKYIKYLESECVRKNLTIKPSDDNLLGEGWEEGYKNFTPTYTAGVINKLKMALGIPIVMEMKARKKK